jgi:hypothetical protein
MSYTDGTTDLVYEEPVQNRLGDFGVAFPVGFVLWIDTTDTVHKSTSITEDQINSTGGVTGAKAGTGDFGLAIFRRGKSYSISAGEDTLLTAAGYGDAITA